MALYSLVVGHCYILVYIRWHKIWIYTHNAARSRLNISVLCFLYQSRWDRRLFIVVTVYSLLFSYSHWFDELCMRISGFTYEEYIWNVPLYSIFFFSVVRLS